MDYEHVSYYLLLYHNILVMHSPNKAKLLNKDKLIGIL